MAGGAGLSTRDVQMVREALAAGRRTRVVFTATAGQIAGRTGQVVRLTDPADGDDFLVVRFGHDELPFTPAEVALPERGAATRRTPGGAAKSRAGVESDPPAAVDAGETGAEAAGPVTARGPRVAADSPAGSPAASRTRAAASASDRPGRTVPAPRGDAPATPPGPGRGRRAKQFDWQADAAQADTAQPDAPRARIAQTAAAQTAATQTDPGVTDPAGASATAVPDRSPAPPRGGGETPVRQEKRSVDTQETPAQETAPAPRRAAKAAKPKTGPTLTVTLAYADGEWTVGAVQGSKALAKPYVIKPAEALKFVGLLDVAGVHEAVEQIIAGEREQARSHAEKLRAELAEVEAKLAELGAA